MVKIQLMSKVKLILLLGFRCEVFLHERLELWI